MSKSCCERSHSRKEEVCCTGTGECCSLVWGGMAQDFDEKGATCVINCKNGANCCTKSTGCVIKCKGENGTKCEINCGCCSITVEKSVDDIGNYCKVTYCEDDKSEKKKSILTCCLREPCTQGKYCVVKCGGEICCVIKG
ncbi:delta-like protein B [Leptopilina heterotoma]|uniref:delta-like protein B n=1 Tax=Leptopilina heterotoma TaxID=63436 RepID=UPI001CA80231|nr:delta-like protein B [Leptopilina heterotoma]